MSQLDISRYLDIMDKMKGQKLTVETSDYMISLMIELVNQLQTEQQAHNALKEKLKETKWIIGRYLLSGKNNCPVCGDLTKEGHLIDCKIYQAIRSEG